MGFHINDPNPWVDSALNKFVCVWSGKDCTLADREHLKLSWQVKEIICAQYYVSMGIINYRSSTWRTSMQQFCRKGAGDGMTHRPKRLYQLILLQYSIIWGINSQSRLTKEPTWVNVFTNGNTLLQVPQFRNCYISGKFPEETNNNWKHRRQGGWVSWRWQGYLFSLGPTPQWEN